MKVKNDSIYSIKLSGWQVKVIETSLNRSLMEDKVFSEQGEAIAESILVSLEEDLEEVLNEK